ncbi:hypothetical protein Kpol_1017p4 [Vanderwaltozyma polyspora DSM 70294]|uniref:Uncharacterized protein n=1 Tax=Vanderwaltozyma polyspora (strain ATCC 22028 / DSM 70294 / BCRC 21397 / CBS 2163 / NBRC 10782 / NRRL Y-8283 / UCD 57-17) TaxID=436907 RepID=A7TRD1_VANPO|nr:uncharacterized protein Kpol_1017p4 [Vanderwaltozyma polyspora DSM 70294]EDO15170.1 hypothetical protein Kpol_1017p4 [Vanderwaltozyma polyspora DSM 70294]
MNTVLKFQRYSYVRCYSSTPIRFMKRKMSSDTEHIFRSLPRVPTTQFLESTTLTNDILFSGYRPITYPVKENPLFRNTGNTKNIFGQDLVNAESNSNDASLLQEHDKNITSQEFNTLSGDRGTGGIKSGGVNGTWRFNPRVPSKLLPYSWWSTSIMGMEYYPEWKNIPRKVVKDLKPYQLVDKE